MKIHLLDPHTYSMVFGWYLCEMARKLEERCRDQPCDPR